MATVSPEGKVTLSQAAAMCPKCLYDTFLYARLDGLDQWSLERRCNCGYIRDDVPWPFEESRAIVDVAPREFAGHGILFHSKLESNDKYDEAAQEMLDEEYFHDVDHGWEDAYYNSFYE